jgi:RNA polymerase sigma-70 factor, ECF subfamily
MDPGDSIVAIGAFGRVSDLASGAIDSHMEAPVHELVVKLYEELRVPVSRHLARLGVPPALVADLCQEAFLRLFQALRAGESVANPRAWIFAVARNAGWNARAAQARLEGLGEDSDWPAAEAEDAETSVLKDERMARIHSAMEGLPTEQRECLRLRAEGFRYREIADIMGVSTSTVAGALRRGVLRIREVMHD